VAVFATVLAGPVPTVLPTVGFTVV
jgi:hypothetical protein